MRCWEENPRKAGGLKELRTVVQCTNAGPITKGVKNTEMERRII